MKRYLVLSLAILGVALFVSKAHAETVFQDNFTSAHACLNSGRYTAGELADCATGTFLNTGANAYSVVAQPMYFSTVAKVSAISLYVDQCVGSGSTNPTGVAYLLTQSQYNSYLGTNENAPSSYVSASNTVTLNCSGAEAKFTFSPSVASNAFAYTVFRFVNANEANAKTPVIRTTANTYPPISFLPGEDIYNAVANNVATRSFDNGTYITYTPAQKDLYMRVYRSDHVLAITYPTNNSTVSTFPFTILGTCESDVDVLLYNGSSVASSTTSFGATRTCTSNAWSYPVGLDQGFWSVYASSTEAHDGIVFFYRAQSTLQVSTSTVQFLTATSTDVLGNVSCASDSPVWFICEFIKRYKFARPYSYAPDIVATLWNGMSITTSSVWIAPIEFKTGNATTTLFGITATVFDPVPGSFENTIRGLSTLSLIIGFVWLIWSYRHNVL